MNFKIGDEIVLIKDSSNGSCLKIGDKGIIRGKSNDTSNDYYAVEFYDDFSDMHDCEGLVSNSRGYFIEKNDMVLSNDSIKSLMDENEELLQALKDLYSVRKQALTEKEQRYKLKIENKVSEILKKYKEEGKGVARMSLGEIIRKLQSIEERLGKDVRVIIRESDSNSDKKIDNIYGGKGCVELWIK